jgi:hypothetical protein
MNEAERIALRTSTQQLGSSCLLFTASSNALAVLSEGAVKLSFALNAISKMRSSTMIRATMVVRLIISCIATSSPSTATLPAGCVDWN